MVTLARLLAASRARDVPWVAPDAADPGDDCRLSLTAVVGEESWEAYMERLLPPIVPGDGVVYEAVTA